MKQITINIPESKYNFFIELIHNLGFKKAEEYDIPEEHKAIVRERIEKYNQDPDRLLYWEDVQDDFKFD
ncbi:MAG: addiction module protein [Bacteroidota bacterium]